MDLVDLALNFGSWFASSQKDVAIIRLAKAVRADLATKEGQEVMDAITAVGKAFAKPVEAPIDPSAPQAPYAGQHGGSMYQGQEHTT